MSTQQYSENKYQLGIYKQLYLLENSPEHKDIWAEKIKYYEKLVRNEK